MRPWLLGTWIVLGILVLPIGPIHGALENEKCWVCHDRESAQDMSGIPQNTPSIHRQGFRFSRHNNLACIDCHTDVGSLPHEMELSAPECGFCHQAAQEALRDSVHGKTKGDLRCQRCHGDPHLMVSVTDENAPVHRNHVRELCAQCHAADSRDPQAFSSPRMIQSVEKYKESVHGLAYRSGKMHAAGCVDCHQSHAIYPGADPRSSVHRARIAGRCNLCHKKNVEQFTQSVHGIAVQQNNPDAPVCITCHEEHTIISPKKSQSPVYKSQVARVTCARCHENQRLSQRYGFPLDRVQTYYETYHGLKGLSGSIEAANCVSCHGVHSIRSASDPGASIHPANLEATCGTCHAEAAKSFASLSVHSGTGGFSHPAIRIVQNVFQWGIPGIIGWMLFSNLMVFGKSVRRKLQVKSSEGGLLYSRFDAMLHLVLILLVTGLFYTGFAFRFPLAGWVQASVSHGLTEPVRMILHRIFSIGLVLLCFAYGVNSILWPEGRNKLDFRISMAGRVSGFLPFQPKPSEAPSYPGRRFFGFIVVSLVIMLLTGLVLWFPAWYAKWFSAWAIQLAQVIHYYQAWLMVWVFVLGHLFSAVFHPEEYPIRITQIRNKKNDEQRN